MVRWVIFSALFLALLVPGYASASEWQSIGDIDGVNVWKKEVEGSSLLAFRGVVTADVEIGQVMSVFLDHRQRKNWVAKHADDKNLEAGSGFQEYWIHFNTPFPVSDRDYVLRSDGYRDPDKRTFTCKIKSVVRKDAPEKKCCVRAQLHGTYYRFEALPGPTPRTRLTVEVHTDPRGMLPKWLVNMIQRKWPSDTLNGLIREAKKQKAHAEYADWHS